jgi:hypothetical protein
MQGMKFAHISPDPKTPGRALIKVGTVKAAVGVGRWLLEFDGKNYCFSNVFSSEQLEGFAFFNDVAARNAFIADLLAQNAPPQESAAPALPEGVTVAPPEKASVQ